MTESERFGARTSAGDAPKLSGMDQRARTSAGIACVLLGLAISMWIIGSIDWTPGLRGGFQLVLLAPGYVAAGTGILLALYALRGCLKARRASDTPLT